MDGGRRGPPGRPADRTANTIVDEAALALRLATAGNTVQAGISLPPIVQEECALVSCPDDKHDLCLYLFRVCRSVLLHTHSNESTN